MTMDEYVSESQKFIKAIRGIGFDFQDCPVCPIREEWEHFPIIKAIRRAEQISGVKYSSLF